MGRRAGDLLGWGYEGATPEDLIDFAERNGATVVVDVRLNAMSRKPGFSKRKLADRLRASGIAYLHLPGLGNPRDNRPGFWSPGTDEARAAHRAFRERVLESEGGRDALDQLLAVAQEATVVVLCFEDDPARCHRTLVLESARAREAVAA
jgi:uncharacterized protein (DUF488 family)